MKYHHAKKFRVAFLLMPLLASRALALVVTDYNSVTNNLFAPGGDYTNAIANPAYVPILNTSPAFIGYGRDFSGVGWDTTTTQAGVTLIGPQTILQADHFQNTVNKAFFGLDGQMHYVTRVVYTNIAGTDIGIGTISTHVTASQATIYPVMDLGSDPAGYAGSPLMMYGWYSKVGTNYVTGADSFCFYYSSATNAPSMAYVQGNDSSSPDFIPYMDPVTGAQKLSVLGAHLTYGADPFLPDYWTNINAVMNPTGYSLKWVAPVAQAWTGGAGSGDFTNSVNWSSTTPGISNAVLFDVVTAGGQTVINLGSTQTLKGLYFKNSGGNGFTISNGLLAVDRVGIVNGSNGTLVIQSDVAFNAPQNWDGGNSGIVVNGTITNNGQFFYLEGTGTNRLNGAMYGAGGLAKDGPGRLIVSGTNILGGSLFVHAGTLELAVPSVSSAGSLNINGSTGTLLMAGGQLMTTNAGSTAYVGDSGVGVMTVSNGTWRASQVSVGAGSSGASGTLTLAGGTNLVSGFLRVGDGAATGIVLMTGGQLVMTNSARNASTYVGYGNGNGTMIVSNGMWRADSVTVGYNWGGVSGMLILAGGTNLFMSLANNTALGLGTIISGGNSTVLMTGGQLVTTNSTGNALAFVGYKGNGTMTVSNGTWLADSIYVGNLSGSRGALTLAGGSNIISHGFNVGNSSGGTGAVAMSGGYLTLGGALSLGSNTTTFGQGSFLLSSGGVLEANTLVSGFNGSGVFTNQAGGVLQFSTATPILTTNTLGSIVVSNAVISYRGVANANLYQSSVSNITFLGNNTFRLNNSTNVSTAYLFDTNNGGFYQNLQLINGQSTWQGALTVGAGGTLLVSNAISATVANAFTNQGAVSVIGSRVTYGGTVVIGGSYVSDPSTNIFTSNLTVTASGSLSGSNGDLFVFYSDFINQSTNRSAFNLANATVVFTNGNGVAATNHTLDLTGSGAFDMGSNILSIASMSTNFGIGTLSLASGNSLMLNGAKSAVTNALYVGWLDLGGSTNNITLELALNVNLYYDKNNPNNAYLAGQTYALGAGQLIPVPEPSTMGLMLGGVLFSAFLLRRMEWKRKSFRR